MIFANVTFIVTHLHIKKITGEITIALDDSAFIDHLDNLRVFPNGGHHLTITSDFVFFRVTLVEFLRGFIL